MRRMNRKTNSFTDKHTDKRKYVTPSRKPNREYSEDQKWSDAKLQCK